MKRRVANIYPDGKSYDEFIALPPEELDSCLRKEFSIGLYTFASLLFEVIREPVKKRRPNTKIPPGWFFFWHPTENRPVNDEEIKSYYKFVAIDLKPMVDLNDAGYYADEGPAIDREPLRLLKQKIATLRKKILEVAAEIEVRRKHVVPTPPRGKSPEDQKALAARWEVGRFLSKLQEEYFDLLAMWPAVGRPSNPETETACLWAQHFRRKGIRIPWPLIAALVDWFMHRLRRYDFYRKIFTNDDMSDPDYLRQKFYKHKKRWELIYAHRRISRKYLDLLALNLEDEEMKKARMVLVFGRTEAELRWLYRQSRSTAQLKGLSARMLAASIHVLHCTDPRMNAFILPDGSFLAA